MDRVLRDIDRQISFITLHPFGKPDERRRDIYRAFDAVRKYPELDDVGVYRRALGLELRRRNAAQFAIIYAYFPPSVEHPNGVVSIRAVRHSRVRNVFQGVRERIMERYNAFAT